MSRPSVERATARHCKLSRVITLVWRQLKPLSDFCTTFPLCSVINQNGLTLRTGLDPQSYITPPKERPPALLTTCINKFFPYVHIWGACNNWNLFTWKKKKKSWSLVKEKKNPQHPKLCLCRLQFMCQLCCSDWTMTEQRLSNIHKRPNSLPLYSLILIRFIHSEPYGKNCPHWLAHNWDHF